jgi:hypothetical protein
MGRQEQTAVPGTCVFSLRLTEDMSAAQVLDAISQLMGCSEEKLYPKITAAARVRGCSDLTVG